MTIRARVKPSWPIIVAGEGGVTVSQSRGRAIVGFDYTSSGLGASLTQAVDSATTQAGNAATSATNAATSAANAAASAALVPVQATQAQAEAGADNASFMTPLRVTQETSARLGVAPSFFSTKADATSFATPAIVPYLYTDGRISAGVGKGWWAPVAGNVLPAHGEYILTNGRYFEPSFDGAIFMERFGAVTGADINAPLQRAIAFASDKKISKLEIPPGQFLMSTKLPTLALPLEIRGSGRGDISNYLTSICRRYVETDATQGIFNFLDVQGATVESMALIAQDGGAPGGSAVFFNSTSGATQNTGYNTMRDLYCSADVGSGFNVTAGISGGNRIIGARSNAAVNCQFFGAVTASLYLDSCIHFRGLGIETIQAGGAVGYIQITGGTGDYTTTPHPKSEDVRILAEAIDGVVLDYCKNVRISSTGFTRSINNTANVSDTRLDGPLRFGSTCQNNWDKATCSLNGNSRTETSSTNGYEYHPDGTIEQWMQVSVTTSAASYSFPITFPTKCLTCEVTTQGTGASDRIVISGGGFTASSVALIGTGVLTAIVRAKGY